VAAAILSETYFGTPGTEENGYAVVDGPFAFLPVSTVEDTYLEWLNPWEDKYLVFNGYGLQRSPYNLNPVPTLTRAPSYDGLAPEDYLGWEPWLQSEVNDYLLELMGSNLTTFFSHTNRYHVS
jgi:hypothetical protein